MYPSEPVIIANTIEEAARQLRSAASEKTWKTWKHLNISGQIIICEICKALRSTDCVVADVTTLNFNLLFEIGFAVGLGVPVLPIRDKSFEKDAKAFNELGLIDTLGYLDFQNSIDLVREILKRKGAGRTLPRAQQADKECPLYVVKSPIQSEGMVRLMSAIKKSGLQFRAFDPLESPRLSLHEALKQTTSSLGVVLHEQVTEEDIIHAERAYSDDALVDLSLELRDVRPELADAPYAFIGKSAHLSHSDVTIALANVRIAFDQIEKARELLLWFGFLGLCVFPDEERFSYQYEHNVRKMKSGINEFTYCIHPAFRQSLGCTSA